MDKFLQPLNSYMTLFKPIHICPRKRIQFKTLFLFDTIAHPLFRIRFIGFHMPILFPISMPILEDAFLENNILLIATMFKYRLVIEKGEQHSPKQESYTKHLTLVKAASVSAFRSVQIGQIPRWQCHCHFHSAFSARNQCL